jgi:diaminopimelate decarboxylase
MNFLRKEEVKKIEENYNTPVYVYSENKLLEAADNFLAFPSAF